MVFNIKGKQYNLPFKTKQEVIKFYNTDFRSCPKCGKVDCSLQHVNDCTSAISNKMEHEDNLWK